MRLSEAVRRADKMRPNTVPDPEKKTWVMQLEGEFAEMMGLDMPEPPQEFEDQIDPELLIPAPYDIVYPLYIAGYIDFYQEEAELWQMDTIVANQAVAEAKAWYRRNHGKDNPQTKGLWV